MNESTNIPAGLTGLILVRLLPKSKSPPSRSQMLKQLEPYVSLDGTAWGEALNQALHHLQANGLIEAKPYRLTEAGRQSAAKFLGLDAPASSDWSTLQNRFLVARALGISPSDKQALKDLGTKGRAQAAVVMKKFDLPGPPVPTESQVKTLLAWQQLRVAHELPSLPVQKISNSTILFVTVLKGQKGKDPLPLLAAEITKAKSTDIKHIRQAVIREWLTTQEPEIIADKSLQPAPAPETSNGKTRHRLEETDLSRFAEQVREVARTSPTGWFGDNKVFLSHLWSQYQGAGGGNGMTRAEFDRLLVDANRQNLLTLSRADLVSAMNPDDVQSSEIRLPNSTFHFIRIDR